MTIPRRVHISADTLECLNDAYEVEPGRGTERDNYLKDREVVTYLIKQLEPLRTRRRHSSRPKIWTEAEPTESPGPGTAAGRAKKSFRMGNALTTGSPAVAHTGAHGPGTNAEDDIGLDWTPEIPFENVSDFSDEPWLPSLPSQGIARLTISPAPPPHTHTLQLKEEDLIVLRYRSLPHSVGTRRPPALRFFDSKRFLYSPSLSYAYPTNAIAIHYATQPALAYTHPHHSQTYSNHSPPLAIILDIRDSSHHSCIFFLPTFI
jgi:hypothetical protein